MCSNVSRPRRNDAFARADWILEVDRSAQFTGLGADGRADPFEADFLNTGANALVKRAAPNSLEYTGGEHVVLGGTEGNDILIGGLGDDALWGDGGNDTIEGGHGVDNIDGGKGDDIITDIGGDPEIIRDISQQAEELGYNHLSAADHVLGVNAANIPDWGNRNTSDDCFHDPFVLFGFLAACTKDIEFSTQVLVLPQRQAALVAKQAACLDILSKGRFRLGVGVGWNEAEFLASDC